ncbi:NAD(P)H dehydrogenase [Sphingomonas spermidinifaciens]|uniref:NAD(P)H dehydrogenase n=2 Tax=Sphingomonas spermidinifaciens TaxID=1141889 RepID=A0A2A4B272_9SPHN|nr:NAD(P)H dehydrogenase [Sphingomonas spermidinifaciens]
MQELAMASRETPIRHLLVLGHPGPDGFNHAIAAAYGDAVRTCGQEAVLRDLYSLDFDPRLTAEERSSSGAGTPGAEVQVELNLIRDCEVVALVYPIWFGMPPAIIKGYVDRVFGAGFAAANLKTGIPSALLHGKRLIIFSSSASTRPWLEEQGQWQGLRQAFDLYLQTIFGFREVQHVHFDAVVENGKAHYVDECLASVADAARRLCATLLHERCHARFEQHDA